MIQVCFSVFCVILIVTCGYGSVNKSVSLYSVRAITEKRKGLKLWVMLMVHPLISLLFHTS